MKLKITLRQTFFIIGSIIGLYLILTWGKQVFMPLTIAFLLTFLFHPICNFFERYVSTTLSIVILYVILVAAAGGIIYFFVEQFISIFSGLQKVADDIDHMYRTALEWFSEQMDMTKEESEEFLQEKASGAAQTPITMIGKGLMESTFVVMNFIFVAIYTFFFLLYRRAFKNFIVSRFSKDNYKEVEVVIKKVQRMVFKYLGGLFFVILIIATLNALGLYLIGVKNAIFWGIFSGCMVIIPYIGTFIGAILPVLHATITGEHWWQPVAAAGLFIVVQFVEGNFITPNIVGSSVKVNPLAAMISVILGGMIWGVGGAIIAIPMLALLKIILDHIHSMESFGDLLDSNIYKKTNVFFNNKKGAS